MILYLIRGLPGAGKSTLAAKLVGEENVIETDQFFIGEMGYKFDVSRIKDAHMWCQRETEDSLADRDIAVANTFTMRWEMEPYYKLQDHYRSRGFDITIVELTVYVRLTDEELEFRNIHHVPAESIGRMRARWEM